MISIEITLYLILIMILLTVICNACMLAGSPPLDPNDTSVFIQRYFAAIAGVALGIIVIASITAICYIYCDCCSRSRSFSY